MVPARPRQALRRARQRLARVVAGGTSPSNPGVRALREVAALKRKVDRIEAELDESQQLHKRLAEITDVVAEVLLSAEQRDGARLRAFLQDYDRGL